jgi:hypothetical protein
MEKFYKKRKMVRLLTSHLRLIQYSIKIMKLLELLQLIEKYLVQINMEKIIQNQQIGNLKIIQYQILIL